MVTFILDRIKKAGYFAIQSLSGTTAASTSNIARAGFQSAIVLVENAAASGSPSAATLTLSFVDGATTSPATAVTLESAPTAIDVTSAGYNMYQVDISGFNTNFKAVVTPAFTGGSSPAVNASCVVLLTDAAVDPASGTGVVPLRKA